MWRKLVLALLAFAALFILTGCIGGGGPSPVQQAIAWVTGIVSKFRGEPIQGATVTLKETGQSTSTDQQGEFRLGTTYRGTGTLRAEAPGYLSLEWPVEITDQGAAVRLRLVSLSDYSASLFSILTGATDTAGTMRWQSGTIRYYIDRSGTWDPKFDPVLREAFEVWSMATRRSAAFAEGDSTSPLKITFVQSSPCGNQEYAGCAGVTFSSDGTIVSARVELAAGYAASIDLALHEIGHTLGLYGHSPNPDDVMYYRMNGAPSPSNSEAAVAAVLYANPPGTTLPNVVMPQAAMPAARVPIEVEGDALAATIPQNPGPPAGAEARSGSLGWWEAIMCRFSLFAPLCGGRISLLDIGL